MASRPTLIIIGAGVAGLSAGIYARMNDFDTTIYEMHSIAGGLCTSWQRKGYTFDGSVRNLASSYSGGRPHQLWQELGIFTDKKFHYYDEFLCVEGQDSRKLHFYTNTDKLEQHLMELSPHDEHLIRQFADGIRSFSRMELPVDMTGSGALEMAQIGQKMMPMLLPTLKTISTSLKGFAQHFKDPLLREGLSLFFQFSPPDFPLMLCLTTLAAMNDKESGYPLGGSRQISQALESRFLELGGNVQYKSRVSRILAKNGRASGVCLETGEEKNADVVVSAADGFQTIYALLCGEHTNKDLDKRFHGGMRPGKSIIQVSLGIAQDFSSEPPALNFPLQKPVWVGNIRLDRLVLKHYGFDPTMAERGKSSLSV